MKRILLFFIVLLSLEVIAAQSGNDTIQKRYNDALDYLQGIYKPFYPAKAFNLFLELAEEGIPEAMNKVAIMYAEGIGIETDYLSAYSWFDKAASAGYFKAYYNMGLFWKYGYGVERDETKALESCVKGAGYGDPDCKYAVGYMSYKGLACKQDYTKALELFFDAATGGNIAASYMIGICYRNGYGIQRDETEAKKWLEKSSTGGHYRATRELAANEEENHFITGSFAIEILYDNQIPETYTKVEHNVYDADVAGKYSGYLVTYDWSGEYVIGLSSLKLDLQNSRNKISGLWVESDTSIAEVTGIITDTALVFTNSKYNRSDRYRSKSIQFYFKSAGLHITKNDSVTWLTGNIQLFSEVTMEPEKPMYISLKRTDVTIEPDITEKQDKLIGDLHAFPNPFRDLINISFNLKKESEVNVSVFSSDGRKLYQTDFGKLSPGVNSQNLYLNVTKGVYLLKVACGSESVTTKIIK